MIKITSENKDIKEKEVVGNAPSILADLVIIMDSIILDVVAASGKDKEFILNALTNTLKGAWANIDSESRTDK
jgi:hypothetical protein